MTDYFVCTASAHAWMSCALCQYAPARTIWKNTWHRMALNYKEECFCKRACAIVKYAPRSCTTARHTRTYHMEEITRMLFYMYIHALHSYIHTYIHTYIHMWKLLPILYRVEWTKGFCYVWSRGRHFSPSLPGNRYLKLGSKSDLRAEISGSIVGYDALAPRPEVLLLWLRSYPRNEVLTIFVEKIST